MYHSLKNTFFWNSIYLYYSRIANKKKNNTELVQLNKQDITLGERSGTVLVRCGKGMVSRKVPLSAEARTWLKRYLDTREDENEAFFLSNYKKRISVRSVQHMLQQFGIHPHQLRHTFCRELVSNGVDVMTVAELAGHSDLNVTRRYSKPTERDLAQAIDKVFS
jgi:integrase/recombinase XerD